MAAITDTSGATALATGETAERTRTGPSPLLGLRGDLDRLRAIGRERHLRVGRGLDFSSNDYLGLAGSEALRDVVAKALRRGVAVGSGGSRLLRGNAPEHEALEKEAACFFGAESALYMGAGYAANAMLLASLPQRGDLILHDELVHASMHEGMRLSRADRRPFGHNDVEQAAAAIADWRAAGGSGSVWLAVESLYSMDGDKAPLAALRALAETEGAMMVVDEAHATGVFGRDGRGLADALEGRPNVVTLHTCGKALGCEGALVCGPAVVRDFLVNRGRSFIFSTAPSPLMAEAVRGAMATLPSQGWRRERLAALIAHAEAALTPIGATATGSPIMPFVLGGDRRAVETAAALQARGFDVRAVRPPAVPEGTARLRLSITLNIGEPDIDALAAALKELT